MTGLHGVDGFVSPAKTRVLLALMAVHLRDGRATIRSVAREAGLRSRGDVLVRGLRPLRDLGLVTWDDGRTGTLRPTVGYAARTTALTDGGER